MFKILVDFTMKSRSLLTNCRRKMTKVNKKKFLYHRFIKFDEYQDLLMENLGLEENAARKVLYHQQSIFGIPQEHIVKQCQLCQKLHIDPTTLFKNAELLRWSSNTLRHRVLLLREMGVSKMHASMVSNFTFTVTMQMGLFKAIMGIPKTVNVADNLLQCLHEPPPSVPPLGELSDRLTVNNYHKRCLRWYIQWKLNLSEDDKETVDYLLPRMKHRSFTLMRRLFDTLHDDIGLTVEQIKKHACLSTGTDEDLCKIIDKIKRFGGADFKELIKRYPVLHAMEYENVVEVIRILEKHDVSRKAMRRCPQVLMINSNKVASRLKTVKEIPELRVLKNNVNVLLLIVYFNTVQVRLEYLRYLNIKHMTIRCLTGQLYHFERFVRTGVDLTKGREIAYAIEKSLKLNREEIRRRIKKHPYWRHVDIVSIRDSLEFLLERFAPEDLHDSLQLIFYPRVKIKETLESLPELNLSPDETKQYTPKEIAAICLYEMEREHHFSGDGVWEYDAQPPRRLEFSEKSIDELSDFSDSENAETAETDDLSKDTNKIK